MAGADARRRSVGVARTPVRPAGRRRRGVRPHRGAGLGDLLAAVRLLPHVPARSEVRPDLRAARRVVCGPRQGARPWLGVLLHRGPRDLRHDGAVATRVVAGCRRSVWSRGDRLVARRAGAADAALLPLSSARARGTPPTAGSSLAAGRRPRTWRVRVGPW